MNDPERDEALEFTPEQVAEIERRLSDDEPYATDQEVREVFARLLKRPLATSVDRTERRS